MRVALQFLSRRGRCVMSNAPKDPPVDQKAPSPPVPLEEKWQRWYREVKVGVDDLAAVAEDQLRPERDRDLGVRQAMRLYQEARDKLASLFAYADRVGDENGHDPAGSGGSPAD
jgi:hypothetical protein